MNTLKKITLIVGGSRGDIQPYIAIGMALKNAGYEVRILTNANHLSFVQSFHLDGVPVLSDSEKKLREDPIVREAMANGDVVEMSKCSDAMQRDEAPNDARRFLDEIRSHVPDLVIGGAFGLYFAYYAARILNIPMVSVALQAVCYDPQRAPWGIPTLPDGKHWEIVLKMFGSFHDGFVHLDKAMKSAGGEELLPVYPKSDFMKDFDKPSLPVFVCQSPLFKDILYPQAPPNVHLVGASIIESYQQERHNDNFGGDETRMKIEEFLAADPNRKPVYCGWGSMTCKSPEHMVMLAVRALFLSDRRGIILGGWAGLSMDVLRKATSDQELVDYADENVLFVEKAAHESLFPRVACTVHHGGAGTTNAALRSGVPTIITPVFVDQFDHAYLVNKLGVGTGFSNQLHKISAEELASAIEKVVGDHSIGSRALEFSEKLHKEDGASAVVSKLEGFWSDFVQTGKWRAVLNASKKNSAISEQQFLTEFAVASE